MVLKLGHFGEHTLETPRKFVKCGAEDG